MNIIKLACRKAMLVRQLEGNRQKLYRMALAWSHDAMLADDLVQETMMLALQKVHQLKDENAFDGWVYTILNNVWLSHLRKLRPNEDIDNIVVAESTSPESELLLQQIDFLIRSAMVRLPNSQRQVISLIDLEGMSYREVADILQIPIGTVMSRLNRARSALAQIIESERCSKKNIERVEKLSVSLGKKQLRVVK